MCSLVSVYSGGLSAAYDEGVIIRLNDVIDVYAQLSARASEI